MGKSQIIEKIKRCASWDDLYSIGEEFIKYGMIIKITESGKRTLCRIENGRPIHNRIIDDYIFIQSEGVSIPRRTINLIVEFVRKHTNTNENKIVPDIKGYHITNAVYGNPAIAIKSFTLSEQISRQINRIIEQ